MGTPLFYYWQQDTWTATSVFIYLIVQLCVACSW